MYISQRTRWRRHTREAPEKNVLGLASAITNSSASECQLCKPGEQLRNPLAGKAPDVRQLFCGAAVGFHDVAIVEEIAVQPDLMDGIDFRGYDLSLAVVDITSPAVAAIPMLGYRLLVVESDLDVNRKYEIVFALHGHIGAVEHIAVLWCCLLGLVPIYEV